MGRHFEITSVAVRAYKPWGSSSILRGHDCGNLLVSGISEGLQRREKKFS